MKLIGKIGAALIVALLLMQLISSLDTIGFQKEASIVQVHDEEDLNAEVIETKEDKDNEPMNNQSSNDDSATDFIPIFTYEELPQEIMDKITGVSWCNEAPVKLEDLSYLTITHWDFDEQQQIGELIVHRKVAEEVVEIFEELFEAGFPIAKIRLVDEYNADDDLSMKDNNTYGFCFRVIAGTQRLSKHAYGLAIDINPVQNPYVSGYTILPAEGKDYVDRRDVRRGMIVKGDVCYNAFISRGWTWGGEWRSIKDYHHFQKEIDLNQ